MDREESKEGYRALVQDLSTKTRDAASDRVRIDSAVDVGNSAYYQALVRWLRNRCFFVTTKGYLGIGPQVLQSNDLMVVLRGAGVPFILREQGEGNAAAAHVLVGHAYVDCLMAGEALEVQSAEGLRNQVFCLV